VFFLDILSHRMSAMARYTSIGPGYGVTMMVTVAVLLT
jgi:hypothetical protein